MKVIPIALEGHKAQATKTLAYLLRVGPLPDNSYRCFTQHDANITYGAYTYLAPTGFEMSALQSSSDLGVDNAEATSLVPMPSHELDGFTQAQVDSGALDKTPFVVLEVNFLDLTMGHEVVAGGTIGEVRRKFGLLTVLELRSLSQQMMQTFVEVFSLTCRAKEGSQPIGTGGGAIEERFPCGFDFDALFVTGTVLDVNVDEPDRVFTDTGLTQAANTFAPGLVEWLTGDNAGQKTEVEAFASGVVGLQFTTVSPIALGDTFRIRPSCTHNKTGHNSCKDTFWLTEWFRHFRGEPALPVADAGKLNTPGAAIGSPTVGTGEALPPVDTTAPGSGVEPPAGGTGGTTTATARTHGATVVDPVSYGADVTGASDSTAAFNAAYAALPVGGGIVRPSAGVYKIDPLVSIKPLSNTLLDLATHNVTLQESATTLDHKYGILIDGVSQVEIAGGAIIGYRDAWSPVSGTTSEWGHCIFVTNSASAVTIRNMSLSKAVGDAVSIGYTCSDVWVDNCAMANCRRQGVSTGGDNIKVTNCNIGYINGTAPQSGIDVEPDSPATATTTTITGNHIHHCTGPGVQAYHRADALTVSGNTLEYNAYGFYGDLSVTGSLSGNTIQHNKYQGVRLTGACSGYTLSGDTYFNNNTSLRGVVTTGSTTSRSGQSSATADHITVSSDCTSITVSTNLFGP